MFGHNVQTWKERKDFVVVVVLNDFMCIKW